MRRSDDRAALTQEVARFQAEVRRLAVAAAREIFLQELERKRTKAPAPRRAVGRPRRARVAAGSAARPPAAAAAARESQATTPREPAAAAAPQGAALRESPAAAGGAEAQAGSAAREPQVASGAQGKKRVPWTRERIIDELATWISSGTAIDAAFVSRHGPPGLVAAARRIFGRFEAALNVASLHASKLAPEEEPPER